MYRLTCRSVIRAPVISLSPAIAGERLMTEPPPGHSNRRQAVIVIGAVHMLPVAPPQAINCRVNGRRTTLKLEAAFAKGLAVIADTQGVSQDELLSQIERANEEAGQPYNLASATRVYTLQWFFMQGRSEAHEAPES